MTKDKRTLFSILKKTFIENLLVRAFEMRGERTFFSSYTMKN